MRIIFNHRYGMQICLLLFLSGILGAQDPMINILSDELEREFHILGQEEIPPYQMEYRLNDRTRIRIDGILGSLTASDSSRQRILYTSVRVGDYSFDNTHPDENMGMGGGAGVPGTILPLENDVVAIRQFIWRSTDNAYKGALNSYTNLKARKQAKDTIADFSRETVSISQDAPLPAAWDGDKKAYWERQIRAYSEVFLRDNSITDGRARLEFVSERKYFVSSEGSRIVQNQRRARLVISASIIADDGSRIPLEKVFHAEIPDELPAPDTILASCHELLLGLDELAAAPLAEPYSGPAILSAAATGVFFHEIFGHRIEGHRLKNKSDGQTFRKKVGQAVLDKNLSVTSDPTIDNFNGKYLAGHYAYDDQGVPAQKVVVVDEGILRSFLMSRKPLKNGDQSNGHGRADAGLDPVSRQSNLFITATKTKTDAQLRKALIKSCKKQGLKYGYFIREVAGGFTTTDRYRPNVFNIEPRRVYRVYTDGRPDELVRGVSLIGTPLTMFSVIEAAGDKSGIFNGICGAESGGVPVSTVAPALLVRKIETQRNPEGNAEKALLPIPGSKALRGPVPDTGSVILNAMTDELERNMKELKSREYERPFFLSYSLSRHDEFQATASLGSIIHSGNSNYSNSNVRLMVGSYELNDENFQDLGDNRTTQRGYIQNPEDEDYWGFRRTFWIITDHVYKSAGAKFKNKVEALHSRKMPEHYKALPDFSREEKVLYLQNRNTDPVDTTRLKRQARNYSSIMRSFPEIISSQVSLEFRQSTHYFTSSEGSRILYPESHFSLVIQLECQGQDAQSSYRFLSYTGQTPSDLPGESLIRENIRNTIDSLGMLGNAPSMNEAYFGPVLFMEDAAQETMASLLLQSLPSLVAFRAPLTKDAQGNLYINSMWGAGLAQIGQRIMSEQVQLRALNQRDNFRGVKLTGNYPVDAEGVIPPDTLSLVENGILVAQMNNRTPTSEYSHSTGHTRSSPYAGKMVMPAIMDMEVKEGMEETQLIGRLTELAREANMDHAYILRSMVGGGLNIPFLLYRLDLESGKQELVRILSQVELPENSLRNIRDYSKERAVYRHAPSLELNPGISGGGGLPLSMILPASFIVEDVRMSPLFSPLSVAPPIVPNLLEISTR